MDLTAVQHGWDHVPQARTRWLLRSNDRGRQHPGIHGMAFNGLLGFAFRLLEPVLLTQRFGLPAFPYVHG